MSVFEIRRDNRALGEADSLADAIEVTRTHFVTCRADGCATILDPEGRPAATVWHDHVETYGEHAVEAVAR